MPEVACGKRCIHKEDTDFEPSSSGAPGSRAILDPILCQTTQQRSVEVREFQNSVTYPSNNRSYEKICAALDTKLLHQEADFKRFKDAYESRKLSPCSLPGEYLQSPQLTTKRRRVAKKPARCQARANRPARSDSFFDSRQGPGECNCLRVKSGYFRHVNIYFR